MCVQEYKVKFIGDKKSLRYLPADKSGVAVISYSNGDIYNGNIQNQMKHGQGTYTWNLKKSNITDEDEDEDESVTHIQQTYTGEYVLNQRCGNGTMVYSDRSKYIGEWINNVRSGNGSYTYSNGDKYIGEWFNDMRHGTGSYVYKIDGTVYTGVWNMNVCHNGEWKYYDEYQTCTAVVKENKIVQLIKT